MEEFIITGQLMKFASNIGWGVMSIIFIVGIVSSFFRKQLHKTLVQIWASVGITIGIVFFVMAVIMLYNVNQMYKIIGN